MGRDPMPWEERLYLAFLTGQIPERLEIPEAVGRCSAMACWLLALAHGSQAAPRRWVHLVPKSGGREGEDGLDGRGGPADREARRLRELVAQAPELAEALGISGALQISTTDGPDLASLDWIEHPDEPVIVVGSADELAAGLVFQGRTPRTLRPWLAGLLGVGSLLAVDYAHMQPQIVALCEQVRDFEGGALEPAPHVLALVEPGADVGRPGRPDLGAKVRVSLHLTELQAARLDAYCEAHPVDRSKGGGTRPLSRNEAIRRLIDTSAVRSLRALGVEDPSEELGDRCAATIDGRPCKHREGHSGSHEAEA